MKKKLLLLCFLFMIACGTGASATEAVARVDMPDEDIFEVLRHLYRWHLDAWVYTSENMPAEGLVLLREMSVEHDEGDSSRYVELIFPALHVRVDLKKSDYVIPELNLVVRNDQFKVSAVNRSRETLEIDEPESYEHRTLQVADIWEYLNRTRNERIFPEENVRVRLADALRSYYRDLSPAEKPAVDLEIDQLFYVAPLSPVSNDLWVFWENARRLIKFASDADYDSEAFWLLGPLNLQVFDLDRDVVVTMEEVQESATAVTKDWVGRTLFNCIVLGQKLTVRTEEVDGD